ncbi:MAG TPA: Calx-beta domain-containing protein [Pyrinomonadaceae bacterium]
MPPGEFSFGLPSTTVSESAGSVTLAVGRMNGSVGAASVNYVLNDEIATGGPACTPGVDYINTRGTLNFADGQTEKSFTVVICNDSSDEFNERFTATLTNPTGGATIGFTPTETVGITDDDEMPTVSVSDVTKVEGSSGSTSFVFTISLSAPAGRWSTVNYDTANGTATSDSDYTAISGPMMIFDVGESTKQVTVTVNSDARVEADETFFLNLRTPTFMTIVDGQGQGTIINDDIGGNVQFSAEVFNGGEGDVTASITITRENGNASDVVVSYASTQGTATPGQDYTPVSGSVTFGANETSRTFAVLLINDSLDEEPFETLNLSITGVAGGAIVGAPQAAVLNIQDDDPLPVLMINDASVGEGNTGTTTANAAVRLLASSGRTVRINYATADGTAESSSDYQNASGEIVFLPGETSKIIHVNITGDREVENNETFRILLTAPVNATLEDSEASVNIVNDDARGTVADFDGDGKTDVGIFRPSDGSWWYFGSSDVHTRVFTFGTGSDVITPGDYTGDGKSDIAIFRPSTGEWFVQRSEDNSFFSYPFGTTGDIPAPADFDGDGKTDSAVFRPSDSTWYIRRSSDLGTSIVTFGTNTDKPVAADFDGDGKADIAVFRPSDGSWWYLRSSDFQYRVFRFGIGTDKPVQGDWTGDGKADIAVFRPATGEWYVQRSEDNSFYSVPFGQNADVPTPGDYDGDGKFDTAVFRPAERRWFINRSTAGILIATFGSDGDRPLPNAFVP